tara:strand:+ start:405 stop:722 length:318 start_codon:yes stop_codon:yes gene_type:complete
MDWKSITRRLVEEHSEKESTVVPLNEEIQGSIVNLSNDNFCLEFEGKELKTKKVRKFLWENRNRRALQRDNAILWSAYMEDEDKSYMGVGALTTPEIAERMNSNG